MPNPTLDGLILDCAPSHATIDAVIIDAYIPFASINGILVDFETNAPPVVNPPDPLMRNIYEGDGINQPFMVTDDSASVTITRVGAIPAWLGELLNSAPVDLSGGAVTTPPCTFEFFGLAPQGSGPGQWIFRYDVSDGVSTTSVNVTLNVLNVNPTIVPDELDFALQEGASDAQSAVFDDPGGDPLTLSIIGTKPAWVTLDQALGVPIAVPFTMHVDVAPPVGSAGAHDFLVRANDGQLTWDLAVAIVVTAPPTPGGGGGGGLGRHLGSTLSRRIRTGRV